MKKPCPLAGYVHVIPSLALVHWKLSTAVTVPYGSGAAEGSITVSPAHTSRPAPERSTIRPWPKSTMLGQLDGRGGGDHFRCRMSQRTVPPMIMQPMLPLGDLKVAMLTVVVAAEAVDVVVVGGVVPVPLVDVVALDEVALVDGALLDVLVTVTVFVPPDPHPARRSATATAAPMSCFTAGSLHLGAGGRAPRPPTP